MDTMAPIRPTELQESTSPADLQEPTSPARLRQQACPVHLQKPIRPTALQKRCVSLAAAPTAPGIARGQVQATIAAWDIPVDTSIAILLTSELVTNAVMHEAGETINLVITCGYGQLGVDVHDTSCELPVPVDGPPDAETGRGTPPPSDLPRRLGRTRLHPRLGPRPAHPAASSTGFRLRPPGNGTHYIPLREPECVGLMLRKRRTRLSC